MLYRDLLAVYCKAHTKQIQLDQTTELPVLKHVKVNVESALEQAMTAQRGSRCVALLFL
jgi:hypothetical protein